MCLDVVMLRENIVTLLILLGRFIKNRGNTRQRNDIQCRILRHIDKLRRRKMGTISDFNFPLLSFQRFKAD